MKISSHINLKERRRFTMENFKGVDFSTSALDVSPSRATLSENFICEHGINHKRHGWNELFRFKDSGGKGQAIGGIFPFGDCLIVHAGRKFYRINADESIDNITNTGTHASSAVREELLTDKRTQGFYSQGRLYIIGCGDYLVYGSWNDGETYELRRVYNGEDTYIPKTTVSINHGLTGSDIRGTIDKVNFLTPWRKNGLIGSVGDEDERHWLLDGSIDPGTNVSIKVEVLEGTTIVEKEYRSDGDKILNDKGSWVGSINRSAGILTFNRFAGISSPYGETDSSGNTTLKENITVTFSHSIEGAGKEITKCEFGTCFGTNGQTNRLFLAGNPDMPHADIFSATDDFTYFEVGEHIALGSPQSAIGGYGRLTDTTMVIYKQEALGENSIYYRTGTLNTYTNSDGSLDEVRADFSNYSGSPGENIVSRYANVNFGGDSLMLSKNGVFGIVLSDNVTTVERNTRERSRLINERLKKHDLSEAIGIVFDGKYYLCAEGVCYVADSRYRFVPPDSQDNAFNYDWWCLTNIPARVFAIVNDNLYFGTADGRICAFDDEYTDRTYDESDEGDLSIDIVSGGITIREGMPFSILDGDEVRFETFGIFALYLDDIRVRDGRIYVDEQQIREIYAGTEVYADHVGESGLSTYTKYQITDVDRGDCSFALSNNGEAVELNAGGFRLHRLVWDKPLVVRDAARNFFRVSLHKGGKALVLSDYDGALAANPMAVFTQKRNVVAKWYTPVMDLGTSEYAKTLLGMTIVTEPQCGGSISFGYETARSREMLSAKGLGSFAFDTLSFEDFSFDTDFATSFTVRANERNFNFIMFRFISETDTDCAVNSFTVKYKINKALRGVR